MAMATMFTVLQSPVWAQTQTAPGVLHPCDPLILLTASIYEANRIVLPGLASEGQSSRAVLQAEEHGGHGKFNQTP